MQLNRRIAYTSSWITTLIIAGVVSAVLCFILIFLQPFDTYNVVMPYKDLKLIGYALPVILSVLIIHSIENPWYRRQQQWVLWNELIIMTVGLWLMTFLSFIYLNHVVNPEALPWSEYLDWMRYYGLPFAPIMLLLWTYLRFKLSSIELHPSKEKDMSLRLKGDNSKEEYQMLWSQFIMAKAQSNYVDIVHRNTENTPQTIVMRSSLSKLSTQVPQAVQVHRSYIINPMHLERLEGNSRKGWCFVTGITDAIPVSPKHFKALQLWLQNRP